MSGQNMLIKLTTIFSIFFITGIGHAQVITEFGGSPARYKGDGDQEPPLCSLDVPKSASEPFFIKWNCSDNQSSPDELRSEVWILKQGAQIPVKIADFLGFPASVKIEKEHLIDYAALGNDEVARTEAQARSFESFLPVRFRMLVRDRAGVSSLSSVVEVTPDSGSFSSCSVNLSTEAQAATLEVTGIPALIATAPSVPVSASSSGTVSGSGAVINSTDNFSFSVCEIESLCANDAQYQLSLTFDKNEGNGQVVINSVNSRQSISANLKPELESENGDAVTLVGQTTLEGAPLLVGIQCF